METITHRELRNSSAEVLRRVAAGESLAISNHGEVVGLLVPAPNAEIDAARARGESSGPRTPTRFSSLHGVAGPSTAEILADLRGDR